VGSPRELGQELSIVKKIRSENLRYGEDHLAVKNRFGELVCEPSRPLLRNARLAAWDTSARLAAEMKQSLRAAARALDTGETARGIPTIQEPVHDTLHRAAQHPAGVLKALVAGADKVLPVVTRDLVWRIISKDAGTVSHGADRGRSGAGL
jgi:hypothetical protein